MIADALAAACLDDEVLARLGGPLGAAARARVRELRASKPARAMAFALARVPLSRGIHASWIDAALQALPARAKDDLSSGGSDPAGVWLARWAASALAPMPPVEPALARPQAPADIARMSADSIVAWLRDVGIDQLAFAVGAPTRYVGAHVMKRIGEPPRAGNLGPRRAAIARCKVELDDQALAIIGARTIAPHTDAIVRRQLVLRLPRTRGLEVLFELARAAEDPIEASPTWAALAAG